MIGRALASGLGVRSEGFDGGPMPSAGIAGSLAGGFSAFGPTGLDLVPSRGESVWVTFRLIYLTNPWVHASVNLIASSIARMPLEVAARDENGDFMPQLFDWPITPGRPTGGQTLDDLLKHPIGGISSTAMRRRTLIDRLVLGNGLWEIVPGAGLPAGLRSIPWRCVRDVVEGDDGLALFYKVLRDFSTRSRGSMDTRNLASTDVVHFGRGADPDLPVGVSPLASCRNTIRLHDAIVRSMLGWFTNSMKPSAHVKVDKLTRDKAREIREMIIDAYTSPENAGKVLITSGDWQQTQGNPGDSSVLELLQASRDEISAAYGVPQMVLGMLTGSRSAGNATRTIRSQFIRDTYGTWTSDFEGDIAAQLLPVAPSWRSLRVKHDMDEQLRPELDTLATALVDLGPTLSVDERREYLGKRPFREDWSEVPWSTPGSMPLDEAAANGGGVATATATATRPQQQNDDTNNLDGEEE